MKTGVIGLLMLSIIIIIIIIRACLGFNIPMLAPPEYQIQNVYILRQRAKDCVHDGTNVREFPPLGVYGRRRPIENGEALPKRP
jgi:hypothetical protein